MSDSSSGAYWQGFTAKLTPMTLVAALPTLSLPPPNHVGWRNRAKRAKRQHPQAKWKLTGISTENGSSNPVLSLQPPVVEWYGIEVILGAYF